MVAVTIPPPLHSIVSALWGDRLQDASHRLRNGDSTGLLHHEAYVRYAQLQQCYVAHELGVQEIVRKPGLVAEITEQIRSNVSQYDMINELMQKLQRDQIQLTAQYLEDIIIFIARLLVMVNVGRLMSEAHVPRYLAWDSGSLRDCLEVYFDELPQLSCENVKLSKSFNAWTIDTIGGIKIEFTDDLSEHLLLTQDDTTVLIFHHASFLEYQHHKSILPDKLAEETLKTLALLFPQADFARSRRTRKNRGWLRRKCQKYELTSGIVDKRLSRCGNLTTSDRQIQNFHYWRDRLIVLKQAYDESTPDTLSQWWHDRRNGVQWYTFWVAILVLILTVFFGLVQCVEGALQVYKAYSP